FFSAVDAFIEAYPRLVEAERENLGKLWRASDYPSADEMRASFRFGLAVEPLPRADDLRLRLSAEHAEEVRKEVETLTHERLSRAVSNIYDQLTEQVMIAKEKLDDPDARLQK